MCSSDRSVAAAMMKKDDDDDDMIITSYSRLLMKRPAVL